MFEFGDRDGRGSQVRLQHPLGVVYHGGRLFVADTYNNKIKVVRPKERTSETLLGTRENGMRDGERPTFNEPGGVSVAFDKLYIADTNNHLIRVADLKTRRVETLQIKGLEKLTRRTSRQFAGEIIELPAQSIEPGDATLTLQLELPAGYKLNAQAPSALTIATGQNGAVTLASSTDQIIRNPNFPVSVPIRAGEGNAIITADFIVYYCEAAKESLCYFKEARVSQPVKVMKGTGAHKLSATYRLK